MYATRLRAQDLTIFTDRISLQCFVPVDILSFILNHPSIYFLSSYPGVPTSKNFKHGMGASIPASMTARRWAGLTRAQIGGMPNQDVSLRQSWKACSRFSGALRSGDGLWYAEQLCGSAICGHERFHNCIAAIWAHG